MLLTVSEVAKILKVNRNFVYKLIKDGELEAVKIGSIKVREKVLNKLLERWKPIKGYEGLYEVSDAGKVKSLITNKLLDCGLTTKGYKRVCLTKDCKHKFYAVHRIVAEAFIPNLNNKPQVNHINGIKTDNRVENLEWCTNSENQKHSYDNGLKNKKLSKEDVEFIKTRYIPRDETYGTRGLGRMFNVTQSSIRYVLNKVVVK